jgi:hypothetical protein
LVPLWAIFGVVDHDILAAGERQRIVQRLRLGARRDVRHDDDLDIAWKPKRARCRDRVGVDRFEDELDVELGRRRAASAHV